MAFDYAQAFDRNIGWVTADEQRALRTKCVAIAGLGGVGGVHLLTLARLGIGRFHLADFDVFGIVNFNRQVGATVQSIGQPKLDTMVSMLHAINPDAEVVTFKDGVTLDNLDAFLDGADLFVDGLDFFVLDIRRQVFARAYARGIPAVTAAPIGMGVGFLAFMPGRMSFEEYFRLEGQPETEQYLRFLMGMAPAGLHRTYLVDPTRVDLAAKRGPSTGIACQLCSGMVGAAALKVLLHRGPDIAAPLHLHFDAYRGKTAMTRLRFGNAGPIQRLRLAIARRMFTRPAQARIPDPAPESPMHAVLDYGRWAPSGDNAQPWRIQIEGTHTATIDFKAGDHGDIYDFRDHEPTTLSAGMLLETLRIAALELGYSLHWALVGPSQVRVALTAETAKPQSLFPYIRTRSVNRRAFQTRPLRMEERAALESALGSGLALTWHEPLAARWAFARLGAAATAIRLRARAAFDVHRRVIDWTNRDSTTGIPSGAVGADPLTLRLMRWALRDWRRVHWMNRLTGTAALATQFDLLPGVRCAAFFSIRSLDGRLREGNGVGRITALLEAGEAMQRFWLTATRLGLVMQPNYATLIFAWYGEQPQPFTDDAALVTRANRLADRFRRVLGAAPDDVLFIGRIGAPVPARARGRSTRRSLRNLVKP